jgi:hypothetical protein
MQVMYQQLSCCSQCLGTMQATAACWGCVAVLDRDGEVVQRVGVLPPWLPHLIRVTQLPASIGIAW